MKIGISGYIELEGRAFRRAHIWCSPGPEIDIQRVDGYQAARLGARLLNLPVLGLVLISWREPAQDG